jgi:hypothetical protein
LVFALVTEAGNGDLDFGTEMVKVAKKLDSENGRLSRYDAAPQPESFALDRPRLTD